MTPSLILLDLAYSKKNASILYGIQIKDFFVKTLGCFVLF